MQKSVVFISIVCLLAGSLLSGCQKDETSTPMPTNNFIGKFKGKISGIFEIDPTYVNIASTTKTDEVSITLDFGNLGNVPGIIATTSGTAITIAKQKVGDSEYSGAGTLTDKTLTITFSEKNSTGTFGYIYAGTKQ